MSNIEEQEALESLKKSKIELINIERAKEAKPPIPDEGEPPFCSFCGLGKNQYEICVEGPGVYICESCVKYAQHVIDTIKNKNT